MTDKKNKNIKILSGVVSSDKMKDTAVVMIESYKKHPKYEKFIKKTKKISVNDIGNSAKIGDKVKIRETKPVSKTKRFEIVK